MKTVFLGFSPMARRSVFSSMRAFTAFATASSCPKKRSAGVIPFKLWCGRKKL